MGEQETVSTTEGAGSIKVESTLTMTVTDLARQKLDEFVGDDKKLEDYGVRIGVQPGGCSGATYSMAFAGEPEQGETELVANGVRLFIDATHTAVLNGLVVDYVDEMMGGGFKIHNPNATSTCGCGKSFSA